MFEQACERFKTLNVTMCIKPNKREWTMQHHQTSTAPPLQCVHKQSTYKTLQHYIRIMLQKVVRDDDVDTVICFHHTMYLCSILTNDAQLKTPCDFTFAANNKSIWIEVSQDTRIGVWYFKSIFYKITKLRCKAYSKPCWHVKQLLEGLYTFMQMLRIGDCV